MSTSIDVLDAYGAHERSFNVDTLQAEVFSAFYAAVEYRRRSVQMTNVEIARRGGWSKSAVTKNLNGPQNWTLRTISELATALDVDFRFVLVDRAFSSRHFTPGGVTIGRTQSLQRMADNMDVVANPQQLDLTSFTDNLKMFSGEVVSGQSTIGSDFGTVSRFEIIEADGAIQK